MKHGFAENFRDLAVYQKSRSVALEIFRLTKDFPREEIYSMTDQVRRSSRSIGAQIAEFWAKRRYEKHFVSKLTDADGEQNETQHWIECARDWGYLSSDNGCQLLQELHSNGNMLNGMIEKRTCFAKLKKMWYMEKPQNTLCLNARRRAADCRKPQGSNY